MSIKPVKILGISGSIRVNPKRQSKLKEIILKSDSLESYLDKMKSLLSEGKTYPFSNSEIILGASLVGAKLSGAEIEYIPLMEIFKRLESKMESFEPESLKLENDINYYDTLSYDTTKISRFLQKVQEADGIILSTPTYFGDRSSVANKFLQLTSENSLLANKMFSLLSVGAKRNGGQETTNVFALYEALSQGAFIVGNGPKTSQYGGTCVGGDKSKVLDDSWGLETCYATGKRMLHTSSVIKSSLLSQYKSKKDVYKIKILLTMDSVDGKYFDQLNQLISTWTPPREFEIEIVRLTEKNIYRCLACNICPIPEHLKKKMPRETLAINDPYACIIRNKKDSLEEIRSTLLEADGILIAGVNTSKENLKNLIYRHQAFIERTRFIRRNDFELTNIPVTGLLLTEVGEQCNPIHNLKVMTSYMRHNAIIVPPIEVSSFKGQLLINGQAMFNKFIESVKIISTGRKMSDPINIQYIAGGDGGYEDTRLDHTISKRI